MTTLKIETVMRTSSEVLGYKVKNQSGAREFLETHAHLFGKIRESETLTAYFLEAARLPRFLSYVASKGITVAR